MGRLIMVTRRELRYGASWAGWLRLKILATGEHALPRSGVSGKRNDGITDAFFFAETESKLQLCGPKRGSPL
jgi:hypothetical protein